MKALEAAIPRRATADQAHAHALTEAAQSDGVYANVRLGDALSEWRQFDAQDDAYRAETIAYVQRHLYDSPHMPVLLARLLVHDANDTAEDARVVAAQSWQAQLAEYLRSLGRALEWLRMAFRIRGAV